MYIYIYIPYKESIICIFLNLNQNLNSRFGVLYWSAQGRPCHVGLRPDVHDAMRTSLGCKKRQSIGAIKGRPKVNFFMTWPIFTSGGRQLSIFATTYYYWQRRYKFDVHLKLQFYCYKDNVFYSGRNLTSFVSNLR